MTKVCILCGRIFKASKTSRAKYCPHCTEQRVKEYRSQMTAKRGIFYDDWLRSMRRYNKQKKGE